LDLEKRSVGFGSFGTVESAIYRQPGIPGMTLFQLFNHFSLRSCGEAGHETQQRQAQQNGRSLSSRAQRNVRSLSSRAQRNVRSLSSREIRGSYFKISYGRGYHEESSRSSYSLFLGAIKVERRISVGDVSLFLGVLTVAPSTPKEI
jgi:hypothetical protein